MTKKNLNKSQIDAASHKDGPLLIVAGAGTGKTTVLVERLGYLIENKLAKPGEILITTFTEKAAAEMEERADKILPYGYVDLWICTFHGLCERILRDHSLDIGVGSNFKLLSQTEQWILIKKNLDKFDLDYYKPIGNPTKFIYELVKHFSRLKDENITSQEYLEYAQKLLITNNELQIKNSEQESTNSNTEKIEIKRINELANAYYVYNKLLLDNSFLDFGDLINYTIKLFKERPNILKFYKAKFKYIMVDEFQDTNWAQYELIKQLQMTNDELRIKKIQNNISESQNLVVCGDDNQAIYKFRGASISNILQFKDDYPNAKEIVLNENYRSGQNILDASYRFIKHNDPNTLEARLGINKELKANKEEAGTVEHLDFETEHEEVTNIVSMIKEIQDSRFNIQDSKINWSDFVILVRANSAADAYVSELTRQNIPNQFMSLRGLYYKPIILDCLAYLKLLDNYHESSAIFRALNMVLFKVGYKDIININKFARRKVWSLYEALNHINAIPNISPESVVNINRLLAMIKKHSVLAQSESTSKVFINFIYESGLVEGLDYDRDKQIFNYLDQFYKKIKKFEISEPDLKLKDFMEMIELELEAGETGALKLDFEDVDTVKIMTVHGAKGLEFKYVFIPNLVAQKFPTINRKEKIIIPDKLVREKLPEGDVHIEEERRLFYVAMTRAKDALYLTSARDYGGAREKRPSKFIEEVQIMQKSKISMSQQERGYKNQNDNSKFKIKNELMRDVDDMQNPKVLQKVDADIITPTRFSFSQLAAFETCPLQYKFNFILKIPVPGKPTMQFGRVMHNTLKDFFVPLLVDSIAQPNLFGDELNKNKPKPTLRDLLNIYDKHWVNDGYGSKEEREQYKQKGLRIFRDFYKNLEQNGWPNILALEKSFLLKFNKYIFKGAIDRVDKLDDDSVEIFDYKTGAAKEKLTGNDKRQLILYKLAIEELFGAKVSKLTFYYLENNTSISFSAKDKEVERLKIKIMEQIEEIKKCNFVPKPGMMCEYCDFRGICEFKSK